MPDEYRGYNFGALVFGPWTWTQKTPWLSCTFQYKNFVKILRPFLDAFYYMRIAK